MRWLIIGVTLLISIVWAANVSGASFNPALGFGLSIVHKIQDDGHPNYLDHIWVYLIFPFIGSLLALGFH